MNKQTKSPMSSNRVDPDRLSSGKGSRVGGGSFWLALWCLICAASSLWVGSPVFADGSLTLTVDGLPATFSNTVVLRFRHDGGDNSDSANFDLKPGESATVDVCGLCETLGGTFYSLEALDGGRYLLVLSYLDTTSDDDNDTANYVFEDLYVFPGDTTFSGFARSNGLQLDDEGYGVTMLYQEGAYFTQRFDFDDGATRPSVVSDWTPVTWPLELTAPTIPGYICTGWTNGTNTFPATGNACSFSGALNSDAVQANSMTWTYKKAWSLTTPVREAGGTGPGPGDAALIGPNVNQAPVIRINGNMTAQAHATVAIGSDGGSRWGLVGSTGTGSVGNDNTGLASRTFDLQSDTVLTWLYEKQHKLDISIDSSVPLSVQNTIQAVPAPGTYWVKEGEAANYSTNASVVDPDTGYTWGCTGWVGTGSVPASGSSCSISNQALTAASSITWVYGRTHSLQVEVEGVDIDPLPAGAFDPAPGTTNFDLNSTATLSADNVIVSSDHRFRYVLERWVGTGNVPLSGVASTTGSATEVGPFNVDTNSSIRWIYRKEARLSVGVLGLDGADSLAVATECRTIDLTSCVENSASEPRPAWIADSTDATPFNYYPLGTQLTITALHQVDDGGETRTAVGVNVTSGALGSNSGLQLIGSRRALAFTLDVPVELGWDYRDTTRYTVGVGISPPAGAQASAPAVTIVSPVGATVQESFFWSDVDEKLYPQRPLEAIRITWKDGAGTDMAPVEGAVDWPAGPQTHIADVPANVAPASTSLSFDEVVYREKDGAVDGDGFFNASVAGKSVLRFFDGGVNRDLFPARYIVVDTVSWSEAPRLETDQSCLIGTALSDVFHSDPEGRNGYVFNPRSFFDGAGARKAHNRATRQGPILPVNRADQTDNERRMLVVWYETDSHQIGWPAKPVTYDCRWPSDAQDIVIASGNGWRGSAGAFPEGHIYVQPDPTLPGYNPNEEHALLVADTVYALRNDLNVHSEASEPKVLVKYRGVGGDWSLQVFDIFETSPSHPDFRVADYDVGLAIQPFSPLNVLPPVPESYLVAGQDWYHRDHKGGHWAKAAGVDSEIQMQWYYPLQEGFYYPDFDGSGTPDRAVGDSVLFLGYEGGGATNASPAQVVTYETVWPAEAPKLRLGETLITGKPGLPDLFNMAAARVIFDQGLSRGAGHLVKLFDPVSERSVALAALPGTIETESRDGKTFFPDLPYFLKSRFFYDPFASRLVFRGLLDFPAAGDPLALINVMSTAERDTLIALFPGLSAEVTQLYDLSRNPLGINFAAGADLVNPFNSGQTFTVAEWQALWGLPIGITQDVAGNPIPSSQVGLPNALTAGTASATGYVTLVENDDESLGSAPVALHVIEVSDEVFPGEIKVIPSDDVFDEKLTLRHSADFGASPEKFVIEWYYRPDEDGTSPPLPVGNDKSGWLFIDRGPGLSEITIEGADARTLSDNWIIARYYYRDVFPTPPVSPNAVPQAQDDADNWSPWAGAPGNQQAQLAEGWIKRVVNLLNPLDARVRDFQRSETNTLVSMIAQAGEWCGSEIALSNDPDNLNNIGLLSAYQTLLGRARDLSIETGQDYGPANNALLNIATRLSDLYMLLANEAYADAVDPTIGFTTADGEVGSLAPAVFAFQNQLDSSLEEELVLLRGRDDTAGTTRACPAYNRLFWNFTNGIGEVAYTQTYSITDQDFSGVIDELDAKALFPQGHGDAWGHYLSAMQTWYQLLAHPNFTWEPRAESVLVGGVPVLVDYRDERKFAAAAAAKARAGAEIVDLTYRANFVDDADGQWQGYKDVDGQRAWGVDEWARRAGQGAYLDWVLGNAMLPAEDGNPDHQGIQKIDRTTVKELNALVSAFDAVQDKLDRADSGLNPLGLAKGAVPFDIDPGFLEAGSAVEAKTHFEQVYDRALKAVENTVTVFDHANDITHSLRRSADSLDNFRLNLAGEERDYLNRLIEIFGYPYSDDIGVGRTYPEGYAGPDWAHFMIVERSAITGEPDPPVTVSSVTFDITQADPELGIDTGSISVDYPVSKDVPWIVKPAGWTGSRRATGELQDALSDYMQSEVKLKQGLAELVQILDDVEFNVGTLQFRYGLVQDQIEVQRETDRELKSLDEQIVAANEARVGLTRTADISDRIFEGLIESIPKVAGLSNDVSAPARGALYAVKTTLASAMLIPADVQEIKALEKELAKEAVERDGDIELTTSELQYEVRQLVLEVDNALDEYEVKKYEVYLLQEALVQALNRFQAKLAEGERLLSDRAHFRTVAAADVQEYRYQDLAFRVFRNDALQRYRAQFDLAARYVYLAAMAYDYETNLLGSDSGAGQEFLSQIFRQRSIGRLQGGEPVVGQGGLADILARLKQNFAVYETQLGFNNPQTETNRFSLREENFRIHGDSGSDERWRSTLQSYVVEDLWQIEDFQRCCKPFTSEDQGPQPGLVIPFSTTVTFGKNFFGWPLSGGDSAYDPTNFATKIRSVGVWFEGYPEGQLSQTPRVYLAPVGADVLRSASGDGFQTREWNVVDQIIPAPFPIGSSDLADDGWIPVNDSLSDDMGGVRKLPSLRAYPYTEPFDAGETTSNSRLVGRSVWNTEWLLVIPGGTLLFDSEEGLEAFIDQVTDIKLFFQTYAFTGN